jgi:hypothetical protein
LISLAGILSFIENRFKDPNEWSDSMTFKERTMPWKVLKLQAILERLVPDYPKVPLLKENLSKGLAGYSGEKSIEYHLSFLSKEDYYVLHDIRLSDGEHYFQIDTLILTTKFALIIEIKNLAGSVKFDTDFNQIIQSKNGIEHALPDPVLQLQRQEALFKKWLKRNKLPSIPVKGVVVISNSKTILRSNDSSLHQKIIRSDYLLYKINQIQSLFSSNVMSKKELKRVTRLIKREDTPLNQSILKLYNIPPEEIMRGVFCDSCRHLSMKRIYGTWQCPRCFKRKKDSHLAAIYDYFLLFGHEITNNQLRDFLMISSPALSTRILNSVAPNTRGKNKGKIHLLSFDKAHFQ